MAAVAIAFLLFAVLAQAATALIAHRVALGAVAASASRVAIAPATADAEEDRLARDIRALVPGAEGVSVAIRVLRYTARVSASFRFVPPGPMFRSISMEVKTDVPLVVAP